ncbi:uncharacterized protein LOC108625850 [Ceratina calcarata]|uniref:Uncharacterized protein LOC108625850 n=1 Tax=Ceratina calcarata TaxID=156304 RepID=A0AAJ7J0I8_9HYME|nr:uncharacterized protein LOC108625850 [Ceratina calcarata]
MANIDQKLLTSRHRILERIKSFKEFLDAYDTNPNSLILKLRHKQIITDYEEHEKVQNSIEAKTDAGNVAAEIAERIKIENEKYILLARVLEILDKVALVTVDGSSNISNNHDNSETHGATSPAFNQVDTPGIHINLPKLDLPKFSGSYEAWPGFADSFCSAIHNMPRFSDAQKLIYLRSCLTGNSADKIESLQSTDANYTVAWDLLEKSYNDPNALLIKHVKAFFEFPTCNKASSRSIGDISDSARKHYRALEALQKPFLEIFPIYAVISKLDDETRLKWKETLCNNTIPTIENLLEFLHNRQRVLEDTKPQRTDKSYNSSNFTSSLNKSRPQKSYSAQINVKPPYCCLCKSDHYTQNCEKIVNATMDERERIVKEYKLCLNCLRANHEIQDCKSKGCKRCNKRHHTLLHKDLPNNPSINSQANSLKSNIACLYSSYSSQILLATAQIDFLDRDGNPHSARVLLDSCSQANFITKNLADKLKLPRYDINVSVSGINDTVMHYRNMINAKFKSRVHDYSNELEFLVRDRFPDVVPAY